MYSASNFWTVFWVIAIAQAFICGGLCAGLASAKNRDTTNWFIAGFLFGVFGLIAAAGMPVDIISRDTLEGKTRDEIVKRSGEHNLQGPLTNLNDSSITTDDSNQNVLDSLKLARVAYGAYKGKNCCRCGKRLSFFSDVRRRGDQLYHDTCAS